MEIPRSAKHVLVELPTGSREGVYEIAVLGRSDKANAPDEQQVLLNGTGSAKLENHPMVLRADLIFEISDLVRISSVCDNLAWVDKISYSGALNAIAMEFDWPPEWVGLSAKKQLTKTHAVFRVTRG